MNVEHSVRCKQPFYLSVLCFFPFARITLHFFQLCDCFLKSSKLVSEGFSPLFVVRRRQWFIALCVLKYKGITLYISDIKYHMLIMFLLGVHCHLFRFVLVCFMQWTFFWSVGRLVERTMQLNEMKWKENSKSLNEPTKSFGWHSSIVQNLAWKHHSCERVCVCVFVWHMLTAIKSVCFSSHENWHISNPLLEWTKWESISLV